MIAAPLPQARAAPTGQMPPYLWSLQAGEDPGRISSSPILPAPLREPPLRLCPTGILANRRPPHRAQPAGPAATPLIGSAQAGVSRGSVCPAALPSAGPEMKTLAGPAARPAPAQAGQPWGAASGPFLPRRPAGKLAPALSRWESRATAPPRPAPPGRPAKRLEPAEQHTRGSARRTEPGARFSQRVTLNPDTSPVGPGARSAHAPSQPLPALFPLQPAQPWRQTAHGTHHGPSSGLLTAHGGWVNGPAAKLAAPHGRDTGSEPSPRLLRSWCGWPRQRRRCRQRGWPRRCGQPGRPAPPKSRQPQRPPCRLAQAGNPATSPAHLSAADRTDPKSKPTCPRPQTQTDTSGEDLTL